MINEINLNNAASSYKKPENSVNAMVEYLLKNSQNNALRGSSLNSGQTVIETRLNLCKLFNVKKPEQVIFTSSVTMALNTVICGAVKKGDHVITTSVEHNAVSRVLHFLEMEGTIEITYIQCSEEGFLNPEDVKKSIRQNTKLMVMTHASNVMGTILDYKACAKICKENGVMFVLDAAQTAGYLDIDFDNSDIDVLAFTGHKALMGPCGIGGFTLTEEANKKIKPFVFGGTGSFSQSLEQPDFLPDKFEAGTSNILGVIGLNESIKFINDIGLSEIRSHKEMLTKTFLDGLKSLPVKVYGPMDEKKQAPVVSITAKGHDLAILSHKLYEEYGIITRAGLHCSPLAHKTIGTYPEGTLRFSFGYFTTLDEVKYALKALGEILAR
ncbi:MAG: aminotransferase class V-fold PLP-dependent enzyme [Defluviitaleaceae bacterium]|nr:aminotransferase class V-fold PLP-dependent enzyme [Defluviitaleaceae bacterium]